MQDLRAGLDVVQLVVFLGAALAAFGLWWRHRSRPAASLMAAFAALGVALLASRWSPVATSSGVGHLVVFGLAAFPWLLALFAWSFENRFPRWVLASGGAVLALTLWNALLPPSALGGETRSPRGDVYVIVFLIVWTIFAGAAAVRLWRAGGDQPLVRARMRLMAGGALVLTFALLLGVAIPSGPDSPVGVATTALSILSAVLFVAGFAPPPILRLWWRRSATADWQQMQSDLIAATTPQEAAQAVAPAVATLLGGGTAIISADGELLAASGMSRCAAETTAAGVSAGERLAPGDEFVDVEGVSMMVRPTAYTPLFGQDERDLVTGFATQLRLALERARLFETREKARAELLRAREDEQTMIMGLAHDLRGSSNTLAGYTNLLRTSSDAAERNEILGGIEASSAHLEQLVGTLLELGRVGKTQRRVDPVDLGRVVDEVIGRIEPVHPGVTFHRAELPVVEGDPLELTQVFENLFTNAVKHGGTDELSITLGVDRRGSTVTIDVVDDGRGIDASDRASIFSLFHRGRAAGGRGSGVGLNLVRRIVEAHHGTIELLDNAPGAHFRLCFPVARDGAST